jgi:hypothetical protein
MNAVRAEPWEQNRSYRNTAENNEANASQIAIHKPSDKTMTPINCAARGSAKTCRLLLPLPPSANLLVRSRTSGGECANVNARPRHAFGACQKRVADARCVRCRPAVTGFGGTRRDLWRRGRLPHGDAPSFAIIRNSARRLAFCILVPSPSFAYIRLSSMDSNLDQRIRRTMRKWRDRAN